MKFASIVLDISTSALDTSYTYAIPDEMDDVAVGCAVLVPFGGRQAIGFIVEIIDSDDVHSLAAGEGDEPQEYAGDSSGEVSGAWRDGRNSAPAQTVSYAFGASYETEQTLFGEAPANKKMKYIQQVLSQSFFNEEGAACAQWLATRYIAPLNACVRLFTPPGGVPRMVRGANGRYRVEEPAVSQVDDRWVAKGPEFESVTLRKGASKQSAIMAALAAGEVRVAELSAEYGSVDSALKSLESKGAVIIERRRRLRGIDAAASFTPTEKPQLTDGQSKALETIQAAIDTQAGHVVLVDGVTGSGKTEVYLQAIERVINAGRTACVLVPEISLTPQTVARFRGRFGNSVAVMHSRMTNGERYDQWDFIRSGAARVVVGARSALFTPMENVGLYVIDEEHEGSYKQDQAPRYHAREVAVWLAQRSGAAVVLGSATPSIEAQFEVAKNPAWTAALLPERANGKPMPDITVVDMAKEFSHGHRSMFSRQLSRALEDELAQGHKAVLLLNQRGFAKFLLCRDCGFVPECPSCSTSLTFHDEGNQLMCHHCGYQTAAPPVCPECGSPYLKKFGAGTQRVEAELHALLATFGDERAKEAKVVRMDADTTTKKGDHQRLLEEFSDSDAAVLLGTQMIAKGLDFQDVTVVGVINADTQLHLPDYRSAERTFDLIQQVAGRAGRADLPGHVFVQTYDAENVAIQAAARYDRPRFLKDDLPKRKMLAYPPYSAMANVLVWGSSDEETQQVAEQLADQLGEYVRDMVGDSWLVFPATPCVLSKLRNVYRWHFTIRAPQGAEVGKTLDPFFRSRKPHPRVNVAVDVDPVNIL